MTRALLLVLAVLLLVGCAGDDSSSEETTDTALTLPAFGSAQVYWLLDGKVWPALRELPASGEPATAIMSDLVAGPSSQEQEELDFATAIPAGATPDVAVEDGVATVVVSGEPSAEALAQIVYTLTQFATVASVEIDGRRYTRADFEEQTPSVLVESPLPFQEVTGPLQVTGTANTFEANFQYELLDSEGDIVDENFVTATSGTGTRGTFDFTTADVDDIAALVVFESSAEDGSRMNEVEIPLTPAP